jgi:hypothetical protein
VANTWSFQYKLLAMDGVLGDLFGVSVNIYDTRSMIGAVGDDDRATDAGI